MFRSATFTSYDSDGDGEDDAFYGAFDNAGDATTKGVEVEYAWYSKSWFGLSGFLGYLDAKPNDFLDENEDGFVDTQVITNAPEWTRGASGQLRLAGRSRSAHGERRLRPTAPSRC